VRSEVSFLEHPVKKPSPGKRVSFEGTKATEDNSRTDNPSSKSKEKGKQREVEEKSLMRVEKFPYWKVPALKPIVEVPPLPANWFCKEKEKMPAYKHKRKSRKEWTC
jgi:hypothetical protein